MSSFASNKTLCHPTRFIILFISKAAVPLALFPERPVLCEPLGEEDAHKELGLISRVGQCWLSQDLLPKVIEG